MDLLTQSSPWFFQLCLWMIKLFKWYLKGSVKEPNMFHNYETEKITHKAAENLQL